MIKVIGNISNKGSVNLNDLYIGRSQGMLKQFVFWKEGNEMNDNSECNIRIEQYSKVDTPEELLKFMDEYITYGIYGTDGKSYTNWENDVNSKFQVACQTKYALCDKERILKYGLGTCWDQVELERFWFEEHNYKFKTFFIWFYFEEDNNYGTHTYLVYEKNNKYYYFEHADYNNKGIYEFKSYEDAIKFQMEKHINYMKECNLPINNEVLNHLQIIEFDIKKYGISMNEYFENLFNCTIIFENNNFKEVCIMQNNENKNELICF